MYCQSYKEKAPLSFNFVGNNSYNGNSVWAFNGT